MWLKHSSVSLAVTLSLKTKWTLTVLPWVYFSLSPCWTHTYKWRSWWRALGNTTTQPGPKGTKGGSQNWYLPPSDGAWGRPSPPHLQQRARLHWHQLFLFYFIVIAGWFGLSESCTYQKFYFLGRSRDIFRVQERDPAGVSGLIIIRYIIIITSNTVMIQFLTTNKWRRCLCVEILLEIKICMCLDVFF